MRPRRRIANVLLYAAAIMFAVWFGGQVFNALMIVPVWSASLPESVVAYNGALRQFGAGSVNFFVLFNPLWVTLLLAAALWLGRGGGRTRRAWMTAFAVCAAVSALAVLGWMAPAVGRGMRAIMDGRFSPEVADTLRLWVRANWARLAVELCGTVCAMRAVSAPAAGDAAREVLVIETHEARADEAPEGAARA